MAFEGLTAKLNAAFKKLRGKGRLSESDIKEAMREIRLALLEADVSYKVVKDFVKSVSERCSGQDVMESLTPAQTIVKIVNEELIRLMGSENQRISISPKPPTVVMLSVCRAQARPRTAQSSPVCSKSRASARCSSPAIFTAPPPSSSWRSSAVSSASRCSRWGRKTP